MKYRGAKYENAIKQLKEFRAQSKLKNSKELKLKYKALMDKVCKEFSISEKTVYRDMSKQVPGLRKNRNDRGKFRSKITEDEIKKAGEIVEAGNNKKTVKEKLGVSKRKMKRINEKLKEAAANNSDETMFGQKAKDFFYKLFDMDLIAPSKGIRLSYDEIDFIITKEDLKDIILILSNSYNRACFADSKKLKRASRDEIRTLMLQQLIDDQMYIARESRDYKLVDSLTRMIERLNEDEKLPDDFETILKLCQEIKPDISKEDVIALIKKVARPEK